MNRKLIFFFCAMMGMILSSGGSAQEVSENICKSYVNMFCVRCHPAQRICDELGVKNETQWQQTIKLMSEYGNLDKDVQDKVYNCVTTLPPGSPVVCGQKAKAVKIL